MGRIYKGDSLSPPVERTGHLFHHRNRVLQRAGTSEGQRIDVVVVRFALVWGLYQEVLALHGLLRVAHLLTEPTPYTGTPGLGMAWVDHHPALQQLDEVLPALGLVLGVRRVGGDLAARTEQALQSIGHRPTHALGIDANGDDVIRL